MRAMHTGSTRSCSASAQPHCLGPPGIQRSPAALLLTWAQLQVWPACTAGPAQGRACSSWPAQPVKLESTAAPCCQRGPPTTCCCRAGDALDAQSVRFACAATQPGTRLVAGGVIYTCRAVMSCGAACAVHATPDSLQGPGLGLGDPGRALLPDGSSTTSCSAVMFLWRSVRMMATSHLRSSIGLRLRRWPCPARPARWASSSPFFTICVLAACQCHALALHAVPGPFACWLRTDALRCPGRPCQRVQVTLSLLGVRLHVHHLHVWRPVRAARS